jgi:hypothetical protein
LLYPSPKYLGTVRIFRPSGDHGIDPELKFCAANNLSPSRKNSLEEIDRSLFELGELPRRDFIGHVDVAPMVMLISGGRDGYQFSRDTCPLVAASIFRANSNEGVFRPAAVSEIMVMLQSHFPAMYV